MANNVWDIKTDLRVQYQAGSPLTWYSIEADTFRVDIDRGIAVEEAVFARPSIGQLKVNMVKKDLTDLVTGPAYKTNMPIRIQYRPQPDTQPTIWLTIFYGFIANISMNFNVDSQNLEIQVSADDTTKILTNSRLPLYNISGTLSNRSYRNCMDNLATAVSAVDSRVSLIQSGTGGSSTYQQPMPYIDVLSGEILTQLLDAELGWCYSQRSGANQFYMTRTDVDALQATTWSSGNPTISNIHSTSSNHYCMDFIDLSFDTDNLVNEVKLTEPTSTPASDTVGSNSTSITNYGRWPADFEVSMEPGTSPTWTYMNSWVTAVKNAADPKRISRVACPAVRRDGLISGLADVEIAAPLQVEFVDPNNTSNKIQQVALVTRINHAITAEHWEITLDLWRGI